MPERAGLHVGRPTLRFGTAIDFIDKTGGPSKKDAKRTNGFDITKKEAVAFFIHKTLAKLGVCPL